MLALILHERTSGRESAYLRDMLRQFNSRLNERGYFGCMLNGELSEQQLSGHNWTLRALNEYALSGREEFVSGAAERIVENLYLPARGRYSHYCLDPALRPLDGQASGHAADKAVDGWYLSTDIGCAYMSLDGLTQYYELTGDSRVGELIDEMFETFTKIDFVGAHMQTHASLTATRGILRYYNKTKRPELLVFAKRLLGLYTECAMTQNYCNYNWFARPELDRALRDCRLVYGRARAAPADRRAELPLARDEYTAQRAVSRRTLERRLRLRLLPAPRRAVPVLSGRSVRSVLVLHDARRGGTQLCRAKRRPVRRRRLHGLRDIERRLCA